MHYSAKRRIEIACRPSVRLSVCPSVTLVDLGFLGWKSWKLIARTISRTPSLFTAQRPKGNLGKWGKLEVGWEKWRAGAQKRQYL